MANALYNPPRLHFLTEESGLSPEVQAWFEELDRWFNRVADLMKRFEVVSTTLDPTSVPANDTDEQAFTVSGLNASDIIVEVIKPTETAGIGIVNARISAVDTVAITFINTTAGAIDPPSEIYNILILEN